MMSKPTLPIGWEVSSLNSLAEYINGYAFKPCDWHGQGLPIVRIAQITGSSNAQDFYNGVLSECYLLKQDDLIFSWSGTLEVVIWKNGAAWLNQHLFKVVPRKGINKNFLFHLLKWHICEMSKRAHGSTMKHIKRKELKEFETYLPSNEDEQKNIAAILDTLDEAITAAESLLAKQEKMKQGLLQDLLARGVDENGQLRPHWDEQPGLYRKTELGWVPISWSICELGDLIDALDSGVSVNSNDRIKGLDEQGILKTSCLNGGVFSSFQHKAVLPNEIYRLSTPVKGNSIIISRMNTPLLVGESAYVFEDVDDLYLPDRLWITRMKEKMNTSVRWLSYVLRSPRIRDSISNLATGTSGSMKNIAKGSLLGIRLTIPSPQEQSQIAFMIDSISKQSEILNVELKKLHQIKTGLMQDLLTGRRRVTPELILQVENLAHSVD